MIFLTVGSQMPFDRLVVAVDDWVRSSPNAMDVFAQIGKTFYQPRAIRYVESMPANVFNETVRSATCLIAHAGMGSVLTALEVGKPIVIMPRRGALKETRNDHQVATAKWLAARQGIFVAMDETELPAAIGEAIASAANENKISRYASPALLQTLTNFIHE